MIPLKGRRGKAHFRTWGAEAAEGKTSTGVGVACCSCAVKCGQRQRATEWQKGEAEQIRRGMLANIVEEKNMWMAENIPKTQPGSCGSWGLTMNYSLFPPTLLQMNAGKTCSKLIKYLHLEKWASQATLDTQCFTTECITDLWLWSTSNSAFPRMENDAIFYLCCFYFNSLLASTGNTAPASCLC